MRLFEYVENTLALVGRPFVSAYYAINGLGKFCLFNAHLLPILFKKPIRIKEIFYEIERIGINSSAIIILTAIFIGLVQAIQIYQGFHKFGMESMMGYTIFYALGKELAPVVAALMVTSRAVSSMAAELGTMRVTEQIDAIDTLAVDSRKYLVIPKIIAATVALPILTAVFNIVANVSSFAISVVALDINPTSYLNTIRQYAEFSNYMTGLVKAGVFGFLISSIGTYCGYHASGGARGVGQATTIAVVAASVTILVADYFLASLFIILGY
ncbi:MAG: ABC transporter permease [Campylobacteraceae bacterium]|nr:ABC transporter permease [Campylobacteraceae bacterium]